MLREKKTYIVTFASIVLLLIISGCVSTPTSTPTPAPIPSNSSDIRPPYTQPHNPQQPPLQLPTINVTSYPANVTEGTNFTIQVDVSGGMNQGNISHASVHWGFKSGGPDIRDYGSFSKVYTGRVPQKFSIELIAPAGRTIYFRAHAVVDGADIYSNEYEIRIIPR
jgi:hypothetical protein